VENCEICEIVYARSGLDPGAEHVLHLAANVQLVPFLVLDSSVDLQSFVQVAMGVETGDEFSIMLNQLRLMFV